VYFYGFYRENSLNKNIKYTRGKIFRIGTVARSGKCVEYEYFVNGKKYHGAESITGENVCLTDSCIKRIWTIGFDSTFPEHSTIIGFREGEVDTVWKFISE